MMETGDRWKRPRSEGPLCRRPSGALSEVYARLGELRKPTTIFWGRNDSTVLFADSQLIRGWLPHAEFYTIDGAGTGLTSRSRARCIRFCWNS
jgi:pimeloyl-ACP methyl ester carboxylesterase